MRLDVIVPLFTKELDEKVAKLHLPGVQSSMSPLRNKQKSQMSGCEQFSEDPREGHPNFVFSPERALRDNVSP